MSKIISTSGTLNPAPPSPSAALDKEPPAQSSWLFVQSTFNPRHALPHLVFSVLCAVVVAIQVMTSISLAALALTQEAWLVVLPTDPRSHLPQLLQGLQLGGCIPDRQTLQT